MKLQYDGGLQVLEIIVVTHEIAQVNDCVIRDNGSLKGGIQADFSSFFESNLSLCSFLTFIFVLFLVMIGLMTAQSNPYHEGSTGVGCGRSRWIQGSSGFQENTSPGLPLF